MTSMHTPNDPTFWEKVKAFGKIGRMLLRRKGKHTLLELEMRNDLEAMAVARALQHFCDAQLFRADQPADLGVSEFTRRELGQPASAYYKNDVTFEKKPRAKFKLPTDVGLTEPVRRWLARQAEGLLLANPIGAAHFRQRVIERSGAKTAVEKVAAGKLAEAYLALG